MSRFRRWASSRVKKTVRSRLAMTPSRFMEASLKSGLFMGQAFLVHLPVQVAFHLFRIKPKGSGGLIHSGGYRGVRKQLVNVDQKIVVLNVLGVLNVGGQHLGKGLRHVADYAILSDQFRRVNAGKSGQLELLQFPAMLCPDVRI